MKLLQCFSTAALAALLCSCAAIKPKPVNWELPPCFTNISGVILSGDDPATFTSIVGGNTNGYAYTPTACTGLGLISSSCTGPGPVITVTLAACSNLTVPTVATFGAACTNGKKATCNIFMPSCTKWISFRILSCCQPGVCCIYPCYVGNGINCCD